MKDKKRKFDPQTPSSSKEEVLEQIIKNPRVEKPANYIISLPMKADAEISEESADESYDQSFKPDPKKYTTSRSFIIKDAGGLSEAKGAKENAQIADFLTKISETAFDKDSSNSASEQVSASIILNSPCSLSDRKTNILIKAANTKMPVSDISTKVSLAFWKPEWKLAMKKVSFLEVHSYYKKLKRWDKNKGTHFAEELLAEEKVPYQDLREFAKNHQNTVLLIQEAREKNPNAHNYLMVTDADTVDFNGIFSAYNEKLNREDQPPTIMTTGYGFENLPEHYPLVEASKLDRQIRVNIASEAPFAVYYPEPNLLILIEPHEKNVKESFVDKKRAANGNLESPIIISNIYANRPDATAAFIDSNPLLTAIPARILNGLTKFSDKFRDGGYPNAQDYVSMAQISQSHMHPRQLALSLYTNRWYELKAPKGGNKADSDQKIRSLVAKIMNYFETDYKQYLTELEDYISPPEACASIQKALETARNGLHLYRKQNVKGITVKELKEYFKTSKKYKDTKFNNEFLQLIADADILSDIKNGTICLIKLAKFKISFVEKVVTSRELFFEMQDDNIDDAFDKLEEIYKDTKLMPLIDDAVVSLYDAYCNYNDDDFYYVTNCENCVKLLKEDVVSLHDLMELVTEKSYELGIIAEHDKLKEEIKKDNITIDHAIGLIEQCGKVGLYLLDDLIDILIDYEDEVRDFVDRGVTYEEIIDMYKRDPATVQAQAFMHQMNSERVEWGILDLVDDAIKDEMYYLAGDMHLNIETVSSIIKSDKLHSFLLRELNHNKLMKLCHTYCEISQFSEINDISLNEDAKLELLEDMFDNYPNLYNSNEPISIFSDSKPIIDRVEALFRGQILEDIADYETESSLDQESDSLEDEHSSLENESETADEYFSDDSISISGTCSDDEASDSEG